MTLHIKTHEHNGITVLTLNGRLTGGKNAEIFEETIKGLGGKKTLVLDMSDVSAMDVAGLQVLERAFARPKHEMGLYGLQAPVERALQSSNLWPAFERYAIMDAAPSHHRPNGNGHGNGNGHRLHHRARHYSAA